MPSRPAAAVRWISAVGRAADRLQHDQRVAERRRRHQLARRRAAAARPSPPPAGRSPRPSAAGRRASPGCVAARGSARPIVSTMHAIVLAVPITMQVPGVGASRPLIALDLARRRCGRRGSRPTAAGSRCRRRAARPGGGRPASARPERTIAGTSADAAAIICAGMVLSQPPISTTASIGCARIISSVSIAIRLRRNMLVGYANDSWIEMVGNSIGSPPASITPRLIASTSLRHVAVAGVVVAEGVGDADDRPRQRVVGDSPST